MQVFKKNIEIFSKRIYKLPDKIELPKQKIEKKYSKEVIPELYANILKANKEKKNQNAINIEKIAIIDHITVASKVKQILKELIKKHKFVFNQLFTLKKCSKNEVVTAFSGLLELEKRNKITAIQKINFGDITVEKTKK